jgi:hypothetical protein
MVRAQQRSRFRYHRDCKLVDVYASRNRGGDVLYDVVRRIKNKRATLTPARDVHRTRPHRKDLGAIQLCPTYQPP